jgi:hypothetical protein
MSNADRVIADLINALDAIERLAARGLNGTCDARESIAIISGCASQAIANVRRMQVRNADGYLVLKTVA